MCYALSILFQIIFRTHFAGNAIISVLSKRKKHSLERMISSPRITQLVNNLMLESHLSGFRVHRLHPNARLSQWQMNWDYLSPYNHSIADLTKTSGSYSCMSKLRSFTSGTQALRKRISTSQCQWLISWLWRFIIYHHSCAAIIFLTINC
jgi:hypothetical protein